MQVWGGAAVQRVHAVEQSMAMMAMGNGCQMALQAADPDTPTVHWSRKLTGRAAQQGCAS